MILYYVYYGIMPFIIYIWTTFIKATLSKSIIFKVKSTFESNVHKWVIKIIFISSSHFAFLIINVKTLSNFQKAWCTFGRKKNVKKKPIVHSQGLSVLNMQKHFWFGSNFEHVNFAINGKYSKKFMTFQIIMFPLWSFKHTKMHFWVSIHLGGSFDCDFTQTLVLDLATIDRELKQASYKTLRDNALA